MWGTGILAGMRTTMRNLARGPITVKYPYQKPDLPERARWAVALKHDAEGKHRCTACMTCLRACPDHVLSLRLTSRKEKTKHIERFSYEVGACMMCGFCVEACPYDAIEMGHDYELACTSCQQLTYDLLRDVDAAVSERPRPKKRKSPTKKEKDKNKKTTEAADG